MLEQLDSLTEAIRVAMETKNTVRESAIGLSRTLTRHCANAIRAMHRQEWENAQILLHTARSSAEQMRTDMQAHPDLYYAGYTQDALKEYVEAVLVYAMLRGEKLPTPQSIGIDEAAFLNGMAEAASELRRYILDILRKEHSAESEHLLTIMEAVYDVLVTFDFPDAVTGGLRHRTDNLRGVLERTRGDVTNSLRQQRLEAALAKHDPAAKPPPSE